MSKSKIAREPTPTDRLWSGLDGALKTELALKRLGMHGQQIVCDMSRALRRCAMGGAIVVCTASYDRQRSWVYAGAESISQRHNKMVIRKEFLINTNAEQRSHIVGLVGYARQDVIIAAGSFSTGLRKQALNKMLQVCNEFEIALS